MRVGDLIVASVTSPPRSLRFDDRTEEQLKILSQLTGKPVAQLIREFVETGISELSQPAALQRLVDNFAARATVIGNLPAPSAPKGGGI